MQSLMGVVGLVFGCLTYSGWSLESIGVSSLQSFLKDCAAGAGLVVPYQIALVMWNRLRGREVTPSLSLQFLYARGCLLGTVRCISIVFITPLFEEFIYRGIFVFHIGRKFNILPYMAVIGLIAHVWAHLYQGTRLVSVQACFAVILLVLLFSPLGLAGAIGFHMALNAFVYLTLADPTVIARIRERQVILFQRLFRSRLESEARRGG